MDHEDGTNLLYVSHIFYSICFIVLCFRFLNYFSLSRTMGPLIITILRMMSDVIKFVLLLMVLIVAFGVTSSALMYPNDWRGWRAIVQAAYRGYFTIYGELLLEEHSYASSVTYKEYSKIPPTDERYAWASHYNEDPDAECYKVYTKPADEDKTTTLYEETDYTSIRRCPQGRGASDILLGLYSLITTVLLLNLLIALFTTTYEKSTKQADQIWKFQRTELVKEYRDRPKMPPPIILVSYINSFFRKVWRFLKNFFKSSVSDEQWSEFGDIFELR